MPLPQLVSIVFVSVSVVILLGVPLHNIFPGWLKRLTSNLNAAVGLIAVVVAGLVLIAALAFSPRELVSVWEITILVISILVVLVTVVTFIFGSEAKTPTAFSERLKALQSSSMLAALSTVLAFMSIGVYVNQHLPQEIVGPDPQCAEICDLS